MVPVLMTDQDLGPGALSMAEALFARLAKAGFDDEAQVRLWGLLQAVMFGLMLQGPAGSSQGYSLNELAKWPNTVRLLPRMACCNCADSFGPALNVILAGAERVYLRKK